MQSAELGAVPNAAYGITVREGLNLSDEALATQNSGTSAPPTTMGRMFWFDETTNRFKWRDKEDTAWWTMTVFATTAPDEDDDASTGVIVGTHWFDATGKAVYVCTDATTGAAVWADLTAIGEGGGGGGAEITGDADLVLYRTSGGGASSSVPWHAASASILNRGIPLKVSTVGAVSSPWAPALGPSVGEVIRVSTAVDLTLALPTGTVPPTGYRAEYQIFVQNTSTTDAVLVSYPNYVIEGASGPARQIPAGQTQVYWITTEDGGTTWRIIGTPRSEFVVEISSPFTPDANTEFVRLNIFHPVQFPLAHNNISLPRCLTAPSADTDFVVYRETGPSGSPTQTPALRARFASGLKYAAWSAWNGSAWVTPTMALAVEWVRDDRLVIKSPANLNGLAGLTWAMIGGQREHQG